MTTPDSTNQPKGIPATADSGLADRQRDKGDRAETRALRRAKPGSTDVADLDHGHNYGPLDSIGKAITAPVKGAAEEDDV
jgi:hypothetical protein